MNELLSYVVSKTYDVQPQWKYEHGTNVHVDDLVTIYLMVSCAGCDTGLVKLKDGPFHGEDWQMSQWSGLEQGSVFDVVFCYKCKEVLDRCAQDDELEDLAKQWGVSVAGVKAIRTSHGGGSSSSKADTPTYDSHHRGRKGY